MWLKIVQQSGVDGGGRVIETDEIDDVGDSWWKCRMRMGSGGWVDIVDRSMGEGCESLVQVGEKRRWRIVLVDHQDHRGRLLEFDRGRNRCCCCYDRLIDVAW